MAFRRNGLYKEIDAGYHEIITYLDDWETEMTRLKIEFYNLYQRSKLLLDQLHRAGYLQQSKTFCKSA